MRAVGAAGRQIHCVAKSSRRRINGTRGVGLHIFKILLLLVSAGIWLTLALLLWFQIPDAWNAPYRWLAKGIVVEVHAAPPGDEQRVPASGPQVVVEFQDAKGQSRRETYGTFNSGGATPFHGKKVGDRVEFELIIAEYAPGATRKFDWQNVGKAHWALGGCLLFIGLLLYVL